MAYKLIDLTGLTKFGEDLVEKIATKEDLEKVQQSVTSLQTTKADKTEIQDMLTKTDADKTYAKTSAISDMLTKTEADRTYAKTSDLDDWITEDDADDKYASKSDLGAYTTASAIEGKIASEIAATKHTSMVLVDSKDSIGKGNYTSDKDLYLVKNEKNGYDIYAIIGGVPTWLDDTTADLAGYATTEALNNAVKDLVSTSQLNSAVANFITMAQVEAKNYLTASDISEFVTQDDIDEAVGDAKSELEGKIGQCLKETDVSQLRTDVANIKKDYVKSEDIEDFITEDDLEGYATEGYVGNQLQNYVPTANFTTDGNGNLYLDGSTHAANMTKAVFNVSANLATDEEIQAVVTGLFTA